MNTVKNDSSGKTHLHLIKENDYLLTYMAIIIVAVNIKNTKKNVDSNFDLNVY